MSPQRILLATVGSLGDLHPYVAVGRALRRRGHRVVIACMDRYRGIVEANGLEYAPMRPHETDLGDPVGLVRRAFHPVHGTRHLVRRVVMDHVRAAYEDLSRAAADARALVTHPLAVAGVLVAERTGLPWASSVLSPLSLPSVADPALYAPAPWLRSVRRLGEGPYRLLFSAVKAATRRWERPLDRLRAELGLPAARHGALFEGQFSPTLNLALFSPLLTQPAPDWPRATVVCGFARHDGTADAESLERVERFLAAGEPPVVFALGSTAAMIAGDFWNTAAEAARRVGRRALLLTGPDGRIEERDGVLAVGYVPYSAVFPRAAVIVHHAGIGTLAQALAAGRPQLMLPVAFDQPDNADRAARRGAGIAIPFGRASAVRLAGALARLLSEPRFGRAAADLAAASGKEDGARAAADAIEQQLLARQRQSRRSAR